ncbi:MAG TPA: 2TM domain-containing protein [Actinomycetota bacterium]|jgi:predicted membrane channel-forming protein YqfA (hemolysin III family)|nr:2TM domain-containing protein [Actinomycetota bacterium]
MTGTITVEQYEQAELQLQTEEARRGFFVHALIYVLVQAALITINLVVVPDFIWFPFPLIGWGIGLTMHYLFGFRWVERETRRHQELVEQRALRLVG